MSVRIDSTRRPVVKLVSIDRVLQLGMWLPLTLMLIYMIVAAHDLSLPGLYGDETIQITPVLPIVGPDPHVFFGGMPETQITVAGRPFPLMTMRYIGSLKSILFLPVAAAFGVSTTTIRLFTIAIAALVVLCTYVYTARAFSRTAAVVASLLLALDQSFILRTKVDWGPNALAMACKMGAIVVLLAWWRTGRRRLLAIGGMLLGLGLYNKSDFSWVLLSLSLATGIVYHRELRRSVSVKNVATFALSFAVGSSVFIWYNLRWPLISFRDGNPQHISWWHLDILWASFQVRWTLLVQLLNGTSMDVPIGMPQDGHQPFSFGTPFSAVFIGCLLLAFVVAVAPLQRTQSLRRPMQWLLLSMIFFLFFCTATPVAFGHHHVINIYPWPHVLVAVTLTEVAVLLAASLKARYQFTLRSLAGLVVALLVASDIILIGRTYRTLEATGGQSRFSDAVYSLSSDLAHRPVSVPVHIMDWGILSRVSVLLDGSIAGIDEPWPGLSQPGAAHPRAIAELLANSRAEYVVDLPGTVAFPIAWHSVVAYATGHRFQVHRSKTYYQRDGTPTLAVYRVLPAR